jgi:hypothetical protein
MSLHGDRAIRPRAYRDNRLGAAELRERELTLSWRARAYAIENGPQRKGGNRHGPISNLSTM